MDHPADSNPADWGRRGLLTGVAAAGLVGATPALAQFSGLPSLPGMPALPAGASKMVADAVAAFAAIAPAAAAGSGGTCIGGGIRNGRALYKSPGIGRRPKPCVGGIGGGTGGGIGGGGP